MEAIEKLLELGFEGATVIRGIMGYGKTCNFQETGQHIGT
jgi:PII-like signaling protein